MKCYRCLVILLACTTWLLGPAWAGNPHKKMVVTLLGTGTPYPEADRFGSAILVQAGSKKLLFDCGRGTVIRLAQAGVKTNDIDGLFLTHLHSDHVVGVPDLWLTGWFLGRHKALPLWGPAGTREMSEHLIQAFAFDLRVRESTENLPAAGAQIEANEIQPGTIYDDGLIRVSAILVDHGPIKPAFAYRIDYSGHSVVISGDTKYSQELITAAKDVDCLIHVAWSVSSKNPTPPSLRSLASAEDAARVFAAAKPRLAVVYHYKYSHGLRHAIAAAYRGHFLVARDLTEIVIDRDITWNNRRSGMTTQ